MYPNSPTETESLIQLIQSQSPDVKDVIKEFIDNHDTSKMIEGVRYYFNKNDVVNRRKYFYDNAGNKVVDNETTNNKLPHNWHKLLVDQKVSYLVGKPITITSEDKTLAELTSDTLGEDFDDVLPELVKNASNKGKEWLHVYINSEGKFDYVIIPAEQVIPIYDNSKRKNLEAIIRYYPLDDEVTKVEVWDKQTVTYYEIIKGEIVFDVSVDVNPQAHFYYGTNENTNGYGWGEVPFIKFANNEEEVNDLTFYKQLIDNYDVTVSETANNLEDIQSLIMVLKGYEGTDLAEFKQNLKYYKIIKTSDEPGSGVDTVKAEVPIQSVDSHLDRLQDSIFTFGQGVNTNTDVFGNSPSGIALKFLFSLLEMKCNVLERKFNKGLYWLFWYVTEYLKITNQVAENADYKTLKATFNKSMLMNELEQVQIAQQSMGVISKKTIVANHPWTTDVDQELKDLENESAAYPMIEDDEE